MDFHLSLSSNEESNRFLRALWRNFEKIYGKCAWMYMPYKISCENKIIFGNMDISDSINYIVSVTYKIKGCIDTISFDTVNGEEFMLENQKKISDVIEMTKKTYTKTEEQIASVSFQSFWILNEYHGEYFATYITKNHKNVVEFRQKSFGGNDAQYISGIKFERMLNLLSVFTNLPYYRNNINIKAGYLNRETKFFSDEKFIDDYPFVDDCIGLTKEGFQFIDKIMSYDKEIDGVAENEFLNAAQHFSTARKLQVICDDVFTLRQNHLIKEMKKGLYDLNGISDSFYEHSVVGYISAWEVLANIVYSEYGVKCKECGQASYSISKRVRQMLCRYMDEPFGKELHKFYSSRSKFLHEGKSLKSTRVQGTSIPQLSINSDSGVEPIEEIPLKNLMEYTGYMLRTVAREIYDA